MSIRQIVREMLILSEELLDQLRVLVDVLPSDFESEDASFECEDDLNRIIPELNDAEYDAKFILQSISDQSLFIETKEMYAKDMVNDETKAYRVDKECLVCTGEPSEVILYCFNDGE